MNSARQGLLDSSRSNRAFSNFNIDKVDFINLINKNLNYDPIVQ